MNAIDAQNKLSEYPKPESYVIYMKDGLFYTAKKVNWIFQLLQELFPRLFGTPVYTKNELSAARSALQQNLCNSTINQKELEELQAPLIIPHGRAIAYEENNNSVQIEIEANNLEAPSQNSPTTLKDAVNALFPGQYEAFMKCRTKYCWLNQGKNQTFKEFAGSLSENSNFKGILKLKNIRSNLLDIEREVQTPLFLAGDKNNIFHLFR